MIYKLDIKDPAKTPIKWLPKVTALAQPRTFEFAPSPAPRRHGHPRAVSGRVRRAYHGDAVSEALVDAGLLTTA